MSAISRIIFTLLLLTLILYTSSSQTLSSDTLDIYSDIQLHKELPFTKSSLAKAKDIKSISQTLKYRYGELYARLSIGKHHKLNGLYDAAIKEYQYVFNETKDSQWRDFLAESYYGLGQVYLELSSFDKSVEYLELALKIRQEMENNVAEGFTLMAIGINYQKRGDIITALEYFENARKIIVKSERSKDVALCDNNIGVAYVQMGKPERALSYLDSYLNYCLAIDDTLNFASAYGNLGYVYQNIGEFNKAEENYQKSLQYSVDLEQDEVSYITYLDLSDGLAMQGNYKESLNAYKEYNSLYNKVFNNKMKLKIGELEVKFDTEKKEQELTLKEQEIRNLELKSYNMKLFVGGLIALSFLGLLLFQKYYEHEKKRKEFNDVQAKLLMSNLKNKELEAQNLRIKVSNQESDLTNLALDITRKNEFSKRIDRELEDLQKASVDDVTTKIRNIRSSMGSHLQVNEDLLVFQTNVDKINQDFYKELERRYGSLTNNEKYLIGLIRLNLSNKEIASLRGISIHSSKVNRYRLRKKLGLDSDVNMVEHFQNI